MPNRAIVAAPALRPSCGIRRRRAAIRLTVLVAAALCAAGCTGGTAGVSSMAPPTASPATATAPASGSSGSVDDRGARSDAVLSTVPADGPGCSAAAAMEGRVVWADARGLADVAAGTPLTTATRFDIASVSKQFTLSHHADRSG